jgi:bifunctional DNase/RNase
VRVSGLVFGLLAGLAGVAAAAPIEVEVGGMAIDLSTGAPVVRLVEKARRSPARELPIWIGPFEAQAIALEMAGVPPPRPMTHDLMKRLVERLGGRLERVVIADLRDGTYFATLHLAGARGEDVVVDARPSDAIALALRLHGRIEVDEDLFTHAAVPGTGPPARRVWGAAVQDLTPEVAAFFRAQGRRGVLVSDVEKGAAGGALARGDVITAVEGEPVRSVDDLARLADARVGGSTRLSVRRDGRAISVTVPGH